MTHLKKIILSSIFYSCQLMASPWFTGPILAPAGHTVPRGHTNFEFYGISVLNDGQFNASGVVIPTPMFKSAVANPVFGHGLTDWMDVQFVLPYVFNSTQGRHYHRVADTSAAIGLQLLEQKSSPNKPDIRFTVQEVFPTGHYEHLNPQFLGTDATGLGTYQTVFGLNFQYLTEILPNHFLRTRLALSRLLTTPVRVHGLNSYGGTVNTNGVVKPGSENDADLAFEFTLTQNWVAVLEGYVSSGTATRFNGDINTGGLGVPASIGYRNYYEEALAPAIEYNFSSNIGLIAGVWFPTKGRNTADYTNYVVALNAFW